MQSDASPSNCVDKPRPESSPSSSPNPPISQLKQTQTPTNAINSNLATTPHPLSLLNRVDEIRNVNYVPNNDDILQSRRRTSDIQKLEFQVRLPVKSGPSIQQTFCMFDVGGQRGERRKWIQVFDGVSAVMFLIDSSSFDAIDDENGRNKLKETINLFYEVWTTRFLLNSNFVLLFNKQDILREKIERGLKVEDHFPEYKLYKFQPTDRHLNSRNSSSEKLNLFRTSSSRSARSTAASAFAGCPPTAPASSTLAATRTNPPEGSVEPTNLTGPARQHQQPPAAPHAAGNQLRQRDTNNSSASAKTKRKSSSLYLFGSSSTAARQDKPTRSPSVMSNSQSPSLQTGAPHAKDLTTTDLDSLRTARADGEPNSAPILVQSSNSADSSSQEQSATANYLAYIKARSFIRDKFIQITRQVDQPALFDQRKFSSPNLPMYSVAKGGGGARGGSTTSSRVDRPKRNVCYHYTTATDTENIRDLFENLQKMVLKSTIKDLV